MNKYFILFFIGVLFHPSSYSEFLTASNNIPYEKCGKLNGPHTKIMTDFVKDFDINTSENETECVDCKPNPLTFYRNMLGMDKKIPDECFFASSLRGLAKKYNPKNNSFFYHCSSAESKNPRYKSMGKHTNKKGKTVYPWTRPFCLNKNYTDVIAKSFNKIAQCFDLSKKHTNQMFNLINHEGAFILNNRSQSGARCLGQITGIAVKEAHRVIHLKVQPGYGIYAKAVAKCPGLPKLHGHNIRKWEKLPLTMTCELNHNPYKCMFYSMLYASMNFAKSNETLSSKPNLKSLKFHSNDKIKKELVDPQFPIALNEVLLLKIFIVKKDKNGVETKREVPTIMSNEAEAIRVFSRLTKKGYALETRKVPFFDKETTSRIRDMTALWSYNVGPPVATSYLQSFIIEFKENIARTKCSKPWCKYRKQMMDGKSISFRDFKEEYTKYLKPLQIENKEGELVDAVSKEGLEFFDKIVGTQRDLDRQLKKQHAERYKKQGRTGLSNDDADIKLNSFVEDYYKKCGFLLESLETLIK